MTNSYPHIYLSPHYDDASLSCGGAIHQQAQAGQAVLVITICAAPPPHEPLSPFAEMLHRAWGNYMDIVAARQAEDRSSMAILGADYLRLSFTDCIYRGQPQRGKWYYNNDVEIFGSIHPDDLPLSHYIAETLLEQAAVGADTIFYAPLAVGHHVDHQLTHAAAWLLKRQGWAIAFYEDYPYADPDSRYAIRGWDHYSLTATLAAQKEGNLQPQLRFLSEENLRAKIDSVRAYASQLETLFGDETTLENQLRRYALHVGEGKLAARIWRPGWGEEVGRR